jgi:ATP-dependent Clp protease ATP-binding subunit ClpA
MKCIGATTFTEYRGIFEKDAALSRRFQKVDVVEPSVEQTIEILKGLKSRFEEHHSVKYARGRCRRRPSCRPSTSTTATCPTRPSTSSTRPGPRSASCPRASRRRPSRAEVEEIVAKIARIPPASGPSDDRGKLKHLDRDLKSVVFGQDPAIEALAAAIKMARSGLGKPDKPIGSFLFSGPTGRRQDRGRQAAGLHPGHRADPLRHVRVHGAPRRQPADRRAAGLRRLRPGRPADRGHHQEAARVLLLDEIEKAHPDVFNVLLQVMDHGTLTDNNGRKADFRNVIIIMTTNAGAETMNKATIGFTNKREQGDEMGDIKRLFTPEFRNRLDAIVNFRRWTRTSSCAWSTSSCCSSKSQLAEKKVEVTFTDACASTWARRASIR